MGMLMGSLRQLPAFSIPVLPDAKSSIRDHPAAPQMWVALLLGSEGAWGNRRRWGWRERQHSPSIALSPDRR